MTKQVRGANCSITLRRVLPIAAVLLFAVLCISPAMAADNTCTCSVDRITFQAWSSSTTLPTSGNYYLTTDVILEEAVIIQGSTTLLNLCLNGHKVTWTSEQSVQKGIAVSEATVNLYDCDESTKYYFTPDSKGQWILNSDNVVSDYSVTGGIITGGEFSGIAIVDGEFNLHGGNIVGNSMPYDNSNGQEGFGGGIYNYGSTLTMSGGSIVGNYAANYGGGVSSTADFTMSGGYIGENTAGVGIGGVYLGGLPNDQSNPATLTVSGEAKISGNKAPTSPNFYLPAGKKIVIGTSSLSGDAEISVTVANPPATVDDSVAITDAQSADYSSYIKSDDAMYSIIAGAGNALSMKINSYEVKWMNGETAVKTETVAHGEMPTAPNETPTKDKDKYYSYTFEKWTPEVKAVPEVTTYEATYTKTPVDYTITFMNDEVEYKKITQGYDTVIDKSAIGTPTKEGYTFNGWDQTIPDKMPEDGLTINAVWTQNAITGFAYKVSDKAPTSIIETMTLSIPINFTNTETNKNLISWEINVTVTDAKSNEVQNLNYALTASDYANDYGDGFKVKDGNANEFVVVANENKPTNTETEIPGLFTFEISNLPKGTATYTVTMNITSQVGEARDDIGEEATTTLTHQVSVIDMVSMEDNFYAAVDGHGEWNFDNNAWAKITIGNVKGQEKFTTTQTDILVSCGSLNLYLTTGGSYTISTVTGTEIVETVLTTITVQNGYLVMNVGESEIDRNADYFIIEFTGNKMGDVASTSTSTMNIVTVYDVGYILQNTVSDVAYIKPGYEIYADANRDGFVSILDATPVYMAATNNLAESHLEAVLLKKTA